jgi:hypothetical protein
MDGAPPEWVRLARRIAKLPPPIRFELELLLAEALDQARFRGRVLDVAREALERLRLEVEILRFDRDATQREMEALRQKLEEL